MRPCLQVLRVVQWRNTHELPPVGALILSTEKRSFPNEVSFLLGHDAGETDIQSIGHTVRI